MNKAPVPGVATITKDVSRKVTLNSGSFGTVSSTIMLLQWTIAGGAAAPIADQDLGPLVARCVNLA